MQFLLACSAGSNGSIVARGRGLAYTRHVAVVEGLVPVFLLIVAGLASRQLGLLDERGAQGLNRIVANLALPALLLIKVGTAELATSFSSRVVVATLVATVAATFGALLLATVWRLPVRERGVFSQAAMRGNLAYVGFPVILAMCGEEGFRQAAVTSAMLIPTMNLLAVAVLELSRPARAGFEAALLRVLANPLVVAALASLGLSALAWQPWRWLEATLEVLSEFALPGALLALGAQLQLGRWRRLLAPTLAAAGIKLVLMPLAGLWIVRVVGGGALEQQVAVLLLATPTAVASYSVAAELEGDTDLAGSCVLVTTAAAVVAFLGWSLVLFPA